MKCAGKAAKRFMTSEKKGTSNRISQKGARFISFAFKGIEIVFPLLARDDVERRRKVKRREAQLCRRE
jgi:hypothetical protein